MERLDVKERRTVGVCSKNNKMCEEQYEDSR